MVWMDDLSRGRIHGRDGCGSYLYYYDSDASTIVTTNHMNNPTNYIPSYDCEARAILLVGAPSFISVNYAASIIIILILCLFFPNEAVVKCEGFVRVMDYLHTKRFALVSIHPSNIPTVSQNAIFKLNNP